MASSLLWTYGEWGTPPSHPPLEQMWVVLSQLECMLLEGSTPLPPLLLCPCSEDQKCLERNITTCHFYATAMLLRILDPGIPIFTNFVKQIYSSLFINTSMVPM